MSNVFVDTLRAVAGALQIPTVIILLLLILVTIIMLGGFIVEAVTERRLLKVSIPELVDQLHGKSISEVEKIIDGSGLLPRQKKAYQEVVKRVALPDEMREALARQMAQSVADYDAIMNGEKYDVSFTITGGTAKRVTLTDAYGNETSSDGMTVRVVAGEYAFRVTDGGFNQTEGTVSVSGNTTVSVSLPQGEWFGRIRLLDQAGNAYRDEQNEKTHTLRCFVPDTVGGKGIYLNAMTGALPDASAVKLKARS